MVGIIKGAWGLQGDLRVESLTDNPDRFAANSRLYLEGRAVRVRRSREVKRGIVLKLDSVHDRTAAERLRGKSLTVSADAVPALPEGAYYHYQLIDLDVYTCEGERLGSVREILTTGANDVYVVERPGARDLLIPALKRVVVGVDLLAGRMVVRLPEGLE